jgi:hypothetical protein
MQLEQDEHADERRGGGQQPDRLPGPPPVLHRTRHRVDEHHQTARDRGRTGEIEAAVRDIRSALAHEPRREPEHERADRHVDEEDPRAAERTR